MGYLKHSKRLILKQLYIYGHIGMVNKGLL